MLLDSHSQKYIKGVESEGEVDSGIIHIILHDVV